MSPTPVLHSFALGLLRAISAAAKLLSDERCALCQQPIAQGKLCSACLLALPYTRFRAARGNRIERLFWDEAAVDRVSAYCWYKPNYDIATIVHAFKYHGRSDLAQYMGQLMAHDLANSDFFEGVDALLPVPLSRQRQTLRGYNQSEHLARGVSRVTGIPVVAHAVRRVVDNPSQTSLPHTERRANVEGIFELTDGAALRGKHLVLIDDVVTIGATLHSLVRTLTTDPSIRISILALCAAGLYRLGRLNTAELRLPHLQKNFDPRNLRRYRPSE